MLDTVMAAGALLMQLASSAATAQGPAATGATRAIHAEGAAAIVNNDIPHARDEAILDAKRKAAEQEVGVYLEAHTRIENSEVVSQEIEESVEAYVPNFAVEKEWQSEGIFRVIILANVVTGEAMQREMLAVARRVNNVVVSIKEKNLGKPVEDSYVGHAISGAMVKAGYRVLDPERLALLMKESPVLFAGAGVPSTEAVRRIASRYLVNVIVTGNAESRVTTTQFPEYNVKEGGQPESARARAAVKVMLADTAEIVCDKDVEPTKASFENQAEEAGRSALKSAAAQVAKRIVEDGCIPGKIRDITVEVSGLPGFDEYTRFTDVLRRVRFSKSVKAEGFRSEGRSVFHVTYEEDAAFLARKIEADPRYRVLEQSTNRIVVGYK